MEKNTDELKAENAALKELVAGLLDIYDAFYRMDWGGVDTSMPLGKARDIMNRARESVGRPKIDYKANG